MKYYIQRGINEYGPYSLADLQRYVAQGNVAMTDLTRSEGMTDWVPVSQVIGNIPVPVPSPMAQGGAVYPGTPAAYGATPGYGVAAGGIAGPVPPDFHWALVLLINFFCNWFSIIWMFVEANFVKKIAPQSKGILLLALSFSGVIVGTVFVIGASANQENPSLPVIGVGFMVMLVGAVLYFVAIFSMRTEMESYYNTTENINLRLSGVMTFFFALYYFQYHFSRIAKWKKTGVLEPQQ